MNTINDFTLNTLDKLQEQQVDKSDDHEDQDDNTSELKYKKFNTMAKEKCVSCGVETIYDFETHIDLRSNYIEGVGQFCKSCFNRSYKMTEENQNYKNFDTIIRRVLYRDLKLDSEFNTYKIKY